MGKAIEHNEEHYPDPVNHPMHYDSGKFECIEVMRDVFGGEAVEDFCVCNAFKYLWRCREKNGYEDIAKAIWYLNKMLEMDSNRKRNDEVAWDKD